MKKLKVRGMRDVTTLQRRNRRSVPESREQIAAEQARLEHERARLERELEIWLENQRKTNARLDDVIDRLDLLQEANEALTQAAAEAAAAAAPPPVEQPRPSAPARTGRRGNAPQPPADEPETGNAWQPFVLEY